MRRHKPPGLAASLLLRGSGLLPFTTVRGVSYAFRRPARRRWLPLLVIFALLLVAPALAHAQASSAQSPRWTHDDSPPAAPRGLSGTREGSGVRLRWTANSETDLAGYTVYRALSPSGPFAAVNPRLAGTDEYLDTTVPTGAGAAWYQVSASDASGNEGGRSDLYGLSLEGGAETWSVEGAFPNPSRAGAAVHVLAVIPNGAPELARVDVLDSGGRRVRRIELGTLAPGHHEVMWDGKNDAGREVAPGVYRGWLVGGGTRAVVRLLRVP